MPATEIKSRTCQLTCPECLDAEAGITIDLNDLSGLCECSGCGAAFSPAGAAAKFAAMASQWKAVGAWIDAAPTL